MPLLQTSTCALLVVSLVAVSGCGRARADSSGGDKSRAPADHRAAAATCPPSSGSDRDARHDGCKSSAECKKGQNGRCVATHMGHGRMSNTCVYDACRSDAECRTGEGVGVCLCGRGHMGTNLCVYGNCRSDGDCAPKGRFCSPSGDANAMCGGGLVGLFCHRPDDSCIDDGSCTDGKRCYFQRPLGRWTCSEPGPCPPG